jgi:hypothetical protein
MLKLRYLETGRSRVAVAGGLLAVGAAAATAAIHSRGSSAAPPATFAILTAAPTSLPAGSFTPMLSDYRVERDKDARLALDNGVLQYFVVEPKTVDRLCLVVRNRATTAAVSTCQARSPLKADSVIWISHAKPGGVFDLYGLVPDGVETASVGNVEDKVAKNAFYLRDVPASATELIISGPDIYSSEALGEQVPAGVTIAPDPEQ